MSTIREYASGNNYDQYGNNTGYTNSFLSGLNVNTYNNGSTFDLSDYAMIKNGSYKKLCKAYYAKQKAENAASGRDSSQKLTSMGSTAGSLAKSAESLMKDSLWQKKDVKTKDPDTGEETTTQDYDWNSITKAVKSFVDSYNKTVESSGISNTKDVLRSAAWMTKTTSAYEKTLEKVGISVGADNKLEVDEDKLKEADIGTLKDLFTGHNSYASKMNDKAHSITNAAARAGGTYNSSGRYSDYLSSILPSNIDKKE